MKSLAKNCLFFTAFMFFMITLYALVGRSLDKEFENQDAVIAEHKAYLAQSEQPSIIWTRRDAQ